MTTSHSSTQEFNRCPLAYKYDKIDGLYKSELGAESNDKVWGAAIHSGLAAYYSNGAGNTSSSTNAFLLAYPDDLDAGEPVKNRQGGVGLLEAYAGNHRLADEGWEIMHVEQGGETRGDGTDSLRIDIIARMKQSGSIYFWDHKTVDKVPYDMERAYGIDSQISRYTLHVREKYGDCAGGIINFLSANYYKRKWLDRPAGWSFRFDRQIVVQTPEQLEFWKRSQAAWESQIAWCGETGNWPAHLGWQCRRCDYFDLCYNGGSQATADSMYERRSK